MDSFERELLRRSPLASAVLEIFDHVFDDQLLEEIWERHRGRTYEDVLRFKDFLRIMRDALIRHGGSAHQMFVELESRDAQPVDESNFYRKLARTPTELSRALLRECSRRLGELSPGPEANLPACFEGYTVVAGDGKAIKNAAKRLAPTRGFIGKLLGAKALVALDLRSGLALAMSDSLDGMTNDVPLVPLLMPQLREWVAGPLLSVWDRQFDDLRTLGILSEREGDAFVVRMKQKNMSMSAESTVMGLDGQGRPAEDEIGVLEKSVKTKRKSKGTSAMRLRRVTLRRNASEGEEDVVVLTNLLDRERYSAADILELYRNRWSIEKVFQQVTETFSLSHLMGCSPRAVILQFAFCLLLYNLMQVIKAYVAQDGKVLAGRVSMHYLFIATSNELTAWAYHADGSWPSRPKSRRDAASMRSRLRELLRGSWHPIKYRKTPDRKPRGKPSPKKWLVGGHTSVQRALEGRAKTTRRSKVVVR